MRMQYKRINDIIKGFNNEGIISEGLFKRVGRHNDIKLGFKIKGENDIKYYVVFNAESGEYAIYKKTENYMYKKTYFTNYKNFKNILNNFLQEKHYKM